MAKRRPKRERPKKPHRSDRRSPSNRITLRDAGDDQFELVFPRCVARREDDMEEVHAMLAAGEIDVAVDELRWLLEGCHVLLEAHKLLGEIALADENLPLARGHLGYAYELGVAAIPPQGLSGTLPYQRAANRPFFEAGKGLAWCLKQLGELPTATEVVDTLVRLDPSDPLNLRAMLAT